MNFLPVLEKSLLLNIEEIISRTTREEVAAVLQKSRPERHDILKLLSAAALTMIEPVARKARKLSLDHFGRAIRFYAPLYLSNYCDNHCLYCGFNHANPVTRSQLTPAEIEAEAEALYRMGFRHVLIVTGESHKQVTLDYLVTALRILKRYFSSISVEVYPMETVEYRELFLNGADGLTIYQETYQQDIYDQVHFKGRKKNFEYRLDTPERGALGGMRQINLGILSGLADPVRDLYSLYLHGEYLARKYPSVQIGFSLPRIQPSAGGFQPRVPVSDAVFVQSLLALRIMMPTAELTLSTREKPALRDHLINLGINRISAGSKTGVGGYSQVTSDSTQFEIADNRSLDEMIQSVTRAGYQPVLNDWIKDLAAGGDGG